MKKQYILLMTVLTTVCALSAMTDQEAAKKAAEILSGIVSGHTTCCDTSNLFKGTLDFSMWNINIAKMKQFVQQVIDENRGVWLGFKSSTLTNALSAISDAESQLATRIKTTRTFLNSAPDLAQQITLLQKITADMLSVEQTLNANKYTGAKEEARKLLASTAMFVGDTAKKAARDAQRK
jgi:hypothetical protein